MKVAHLGNIANVAYFLANAMKTNYNVDSIIYLPITPSSESAKKIIYGYESGNPLNLIIRYYKNPNKLLRHINILKLALDDFDVIHLHEGGQISGSLMAKISGAKIIRHFHGSDIRKPWVTTKRNLIKLFYKIIKEDKVILATSDLLNYLPYNYQKMIAETLPNLIDPMLLTTDELLSGQVIFLPTRHDEDTKKTSIAFKAWMKLKETNDKVILKTISWGKNYSSFKNTLKKDERVHWLPPLNRRQYIDELNQSTVIWGQFQLGRFGLTELEAMYCRRPLITKVDVNAYDSLPKLTNFNCDTPEKIAALTEILLVDKYERENVVTKLKGWVDQKNDPKKIALRLKQIYDDL
jgi:glycosyltransferase involved in cell wall biosynthesis